MTNYEEEKYLNWYKIDNAAIIFALVLSKQRTSMFRLSATLKERIKVEQLQQAVDNIIERFPYFKVELKTGLFWHYWQTNENRIKLEPEVKYPNNYHPIKKEGVFPFRIRVYHKRIAIEFSHILTDGHGGMTFLRALIAEYLFLQGLKAEDYGDIPRPGEKPHPEEYEDAYMRYYEKGFPMEKMGKKAFHLPYDVINKHLVITGILPLKQALALSKQKHVSLTEYLVSIYVESILEIYKEEKKKRKVKRHAIKIVVPVDLRRILPSKTMRNFSLFANPGIDPRLGDYTFDDILNEVHHHMRLYTDKRFMKKQIARNVRGQLNPFIRALPLPIKKLGGGFLYKKFAGNYFSGVLSNLGIISMPEPLDQHIERFGFITGLGPQRKTGASMLSHKDKLYITFARMCEETELEKLFFRKLADKGLHISIETN